MTEERNRETKKHRIKLCGIIIMYSINRLHIILSFVVHFLFRFFFFTQLSGCLRLNWFLFCHQNFFEFIFFCFVFFCHVIQDWRIKIFRRWETMKKIQIHIRYLYKNMEYVNSRFHFTLSFLLPILFPIIYFLNQRFK